MLDTAFSGRAMTTLLLVLIVALVLALIVMAYVLRMLVYKLNGTAAHRAQCSKELYFTRNAYRAIYDVLDPYKGCCGGVYKRIDEIRETTEAIRDHRPELFQQVFGLLHWLEASDEFLCRLRDAAMPEGSPLHDETRVFWQRTGRRTNRIYDEVRVQLQSRRV